ncbi:MAG: 2-(3-amino-3-carboxypropyl)histidine synthase [Candidatus Woesearchaeota archaeon]|nr:2-(3-amino-3-carboxypropyl)histidine synthase [Candidatus Woesearchaeota archaeon]
MKVMFVETRIKKDIELKKSEIDKLPKKIALVTTVQHIGQIQKVKESIEDTGREVVLVKGKHSKYNGQILGCDILDLDPVDTDAFLYIGTGEFHAKQILIAHDTKVFVYNPVSEKFYDLKPRKVRKILKKQKGAYLKFMHSDEIGVILSTKPGQNNLDIALKLKNKYRDKNFYYVVFNTINFSELENFPFIECFVNAACPRIGYDDNINIKKSIININKVI